LSHVERRTLASDNSLAQFSHYAMEDRTSLNSETFLQAISVYLDEVKPDKLAREQVEGWNLNWTEESEEEADLINTLSNTIFGILSISSYYITILLRVTTQWKYEDQIGELSFNLGVRAHFRSNSEIKRDKEEYNDADKWQPDKKVRATMLKRLKQDDYIKKILINEFSTVCETTIITKDKSEVEERVWISGDLLESIRRAIYSQSESALDVVELLASLPYLKTRECPLGGRAKLRLLEEAMNDACEEAEEEELIDGLKIQSKTSVDEDKVYTAKKIRR